MSETGSDGSWVKEVDLKREAAPKGASESSSESSKESLEGDEVFLRDKKREESEESEESEEEEEARQRRRLAGRTDILGIDGLALFCLIWVITTGAGAR